MSKLSNYNNNRHLREQQVTESSYHEIVKNENLIKVLSGRNRSYIDEFYLFLYHFDYPPNLIEDIAIDCPKARVWFMDHFNLRLEDGYFSKVKIPRFDDILIDDAYFFIYDDLLT